jgi:hypothetical protein
VLKEGTVRTADGDTAEAIPVPEITRVGRKPPCVVATGKVDPVMIDVDDGVATVRGATDETVAGDRAAIVLEAYAGLVAPAVRPKELDAPCTTRACEDGYPPRMVDMSENSQRCERDKNGPTA